MLLGIGGWTFSEEGVFTSLGENASVEAFAKSAMRFVQQWDLDGLDIDWEYPRTVQEGYQLSYLLQLIRQVSTLFLIQRQQTC